MLFSHNNIIIKTAFDELKFNPTIVTYLLCYITEDRITVSKKSADFTDFWTPIRCVQCLRLTRYCMSSVNEIYTGTSAYISLKQCIISHCLMTHSAYLISIPEPVLYVIYMD